MIYRDRWLNEKVLNDLSVLKWDATSRWSFRPNPAWGSIDYTIVTIEMTTRGKTHLIVAVGNRRCPWFFSMCHCKVTTSVVMWIWEAHNRSFMFLFFVFLFLKSLSVYYHDDRCDTISDVALPVHFRCQFCQINAIESLFQHFRIKYFHVIIMLIEFRNTT